MGSKDPARWEGACFSDYFQVGSGHKNWVCFCYLSSPGSLKPIAERFLGFLNPWL